MLVILQFSTFFYLTDGFFLIRTGAISGQQLQCDICSDDICLLSYLWYLFYGFPTVFPFDGLVLWVRTGAVFGQQLQSDISNNDIGFLLYL
jgi:hypothetical protein